MSRKIITSRGEFPWRRTQGPCQTVPVAVTSLRTTWCRPLRAAPSRSGPTVLAGPRGRTAGAAHGGGRRVRSLMSAGRTEGQRKSMAQGSVKWFNAEKGYGFIAQDGGGADVFVHYSAIETQGYRTLDEAQRVEFEITQGPKGPQAENVRPL